VPRIVFIGAGSCGFTVRLVVDILGYESLQDSEFVFQDVDKTRLDRVKIVLDEYMKSHGFARKTLYTKNRKRALEGADFVFCLAKIGFLEACHQDMDVPKRFGLKQTIGDICGVAGVFRGLRTMPFVGQMLGEMESLSAPGAVVLNYTNPPPIIGLYAAKVSRIPFIGLCHSVQGTTRRVADFLNLPYGEMVYKVGGINHMAWITEMRHGGRDVYPRFRRKVAEFDIYSQDIAIDDPYFPQLGAARLDMVRRVGYMVTESSVHFPEYVPHYLRSDELIAKYRIPVDQYRLNIARREKAYEAVVAKAKKGKLPPMAPSVEYGSQIINSMVADEPCEIYATVPNTGLIDNLPRESNVEVKCLVDRNGAHPCHFGPLPTPLAALCQTNINVHQLAVEAILNRSRRSVYHALMLDPLTSTMLTLDQIEAVVDELVEKQSVYLGKYLKSRST
jgi:alpha-galactosidase